MKNIIISLLFLLSTNVIFSQADSLLLYSFCLTELDKKVTLSDSLNYKISPQIYSGAKLAAHFKQGKGKELVVKVFSISKKQSNTTNYLYLDITNKSNGELMKILIKNHSLNSKKKDEIVFRKGCFLITNRVSVKDWKIINHKKISEFELGSFLELNPILNYTQDATNKVSSEKTTYKISEPITFSFTFNNTKPQFYTNGDCKPVIMYVILKRTGSKWMFNSSFFGPQKTCGLPYTFMSDKQSIKLAKSGTYKIAWLDRTKKVWITNEIKIVDE